MTEKVFLNGKIVDADKAMVPVSDVGFLYSAGLFETMQSRNDIVFALNDHLDRLMYSIKALKMQDVYDKKYFSDAIYQTLKANRIRDARIRLTFTNGSTTDAKEQRPTVLVKTTKFQGYPADYYQNGVKVTLSSFKQNATDPTISHKTSNYFSRLLTLSKANEAGAVESLRFTTDNKLAEGCVSNVFLVKDSVLYTPPIETHILAGIARNLICILALKNSIRLQEDDLFISELLGADEVFISNVIMQVLPVTSIEKHQVGDGKPGPLTKKLADLFEHEVQKQCKCKLSSDSGKKS